MPPRRKVSVLKGEGFISDFVDKRLNARPKVVNTYLNSYGKQMIKRIIISRTSVQKAVQGALNALTMGEWNQNKARLNFDDVYHLFMLVELESGIILRIEKNSRVSIQQSNRTMGDTMRVVESINDTLLNMFEKAEKLVGITDLYRYNAFSTNCQHFIFSMLQAVNRGTTDLREYIMQDPDQLVQSTALKKASGFFTDLDAFANYVVKGGKKKTTARKTTAKKKTARKKTVI